MIAEPLLTSELRRLRPRLLIAGVDPEDLAQDVRLALWQTPPPSPDHRLSIRSALFTAFRQATGWSRRKKAVRLPTTSDDVLRFVPVSPALPDPILWRTVDRVCTPHQARVVRGTYLEGRTNEDLAAERGSSTRAVCDARLKGLGHLRKALTCG